MCSTQCKILRKNRLQRCRRDLYGNSILDYQKNGAILKKADSDY